MKCPMCGGAMEQGNIFGDRYTMKWMPENKELFLGIWAFGGESVGGRKSGILSRPSASGYKCALCRKIVIDMD